MKTFTRTLILAMTVILSGTAYSQTFEQSLEAYDKKDYTTAFAGFKSAAEQGNVSAQYNLGLIYAYGVGVPEDVEKAYFWWLLSSTDGNQTSVRNRDIIEKRLTLQQRANAQVSARTWTPMPNGRPTICVWPPAPPQ